MVAKGFPLPAKLRDDAIVEALFEMRFEMSTVPEVFFGRLIDDALWKGFSQRRLPAYDIPQGLRQVEPNLRFQPLMELADTTERHAVAVRFGPNVLSYHRTRSYVGWARFQPELEKVVQIAFKKTEGLIIRRLGLRYMNALTKSRHGVASTNDLDFSVQVAQTQLSGEMNLNYFVEDPPRFRCKVGIATPGLVTGQLPEGTAVFIDVDVFTRDGFTSTDCSEILKWIDGAHTMEKSEFFRLLTETTVNALKES